MANATSYLSPNLNGLNIKKIENFRVSNFLFVDLRRSETFDSTNRKLVRVTSALDGCKDAERNYNEGRWNRRNLNNALGFSFLLSQFTIEPCQARERRNRQSIPTEEYKTDSRGLQYYDIQEGKGAIAEKGSTISVHFDCIYKTLNVVSSRESKLLGGNRVIAEPYDFIVGSVPGRERKRDLVDSANGLYSAQAAPKPPRALYTITEGMRVGGKRTVIVPPEEGYGTKGFAEIPPGATFELNIELLEIKS